MQRDANIALVPIVGDLDVTNAERLRRTIDALIEGGCRRIVLNMAACPFVDSAGMALVLSEIRHMRQRGGLLSLTNVSAPVMRAFRICRIVDLAPISGMGPKPEVPALDPSVQPLWRSSVKVNPENMAQTRGHIERLLERAPLSDDDRFDCNLAIGEAMGNAVDHTERGFAVVTVAGYEDRVVAEVADRGCGFDPDDVQEADDSCLAGDVGAAGAGPAADVVPAERGRGIRMMRLLADQVDIVRRSCGGTTVRIIKLVGQG